MKPIEKSLRAMASCHWIRGLRKNALWIVGGAASTALILISCATTGHTMMAPPSVPGASFVGSGECEQCHEKTTKDFKTADHSRLQAKGPNAVDMGCESCHGPGSKHIESGGGAGTIVNPNNSPEACYQCHLDKKAQFSMPFSHPVNQGKMSCSDCHNPHKGSAMKGGGTQLAAMNETCTKCHTAQRGPFAVEHEAIREGCTSCHNPHGTTNQKMLTERNADLCLKCHFQDQSFGQAPNATTLRIGGNAHSVLGGRLAEGTCWTAGCHQGVHGSNTDKHLRE